MLEFDTPPTTMIGSMPCHTADEALDLLERYPLGIPAWPQLPRRSFKEGMVAQCSEGLPGICCDETEKRLSIEDGENLPGSYAEFYERVLSGDPDCFAISTDYAAGFAAFVGRRCRVEKIPAVKGQIAGPFTVGLSLSIGEGTSAWFDEQYRDVIVKAVTKKALWQLARLRPLAGEVLIFFDEPIFAALGTPAYIGISDEQVTGTYDEICGELHAAGAIAGVHCCGNMDWGLLTRTPIDVISFDAYSFGDRVALYAGEIDAFLRRGGWLAWGLVPTGGPALVARETIPALLSRRDELAALFAAKGVDRDRMVRQMLFTPSCGMGMLPADSAEQVLQLLFQLRQAI